MQNKEKRFLALLPFLIVILVFIIAISASASAENLDDNNAGNANSTDCIGEGQTIPVIPNPPSCCPGLSLILPKEEAILGISGVCTAKCGDGTCNPDTESIYNCPQDCKTACSEENQNCGGIAGISCCSGLTCQIKENYPDAMGTCVKEAQKNFYISSVWTDKEKYALNEEKNLKQMQIFAKIVDFDGSPSLPEEGTTAYAAINGAIYTPAEGTTSTAVSEAIPLSYNPATNYYEAKTNIPNYEGTFSILVNAKNPNRSPNYVSNSAKFFVAGTGVQDTIYANLNENFSFAEGQQANVRENNETVMKIKFENVISLLCQKNTSTQDSETKPGVACGGSYAQFSISTASSGQYNIRLLFGESTNVGEYKITLSNLYYKENKWIATLIVQKESETNVYARLDEAFWLNTSQTAILKEQGLELTLVNLEQTVVCQGTGCPPSETIAYLKTNLPPYKLSISEGGTQTVGDYSIKFNSAKENLVANFTVSKQAGQQVKIVSLDEKFELLSEQTAQVKETGMSIKLLGIAMPTQIGSTSAGMGTSTGNIVASTIRSLNGESTTAYSTTAQSVSSSGKVEEVKAPIQIDSRQAARLLISMPLPCEAGNSSCTSNATEIWLRQGESRTIFGYRIHALQIDSGRIVLIVKKDIEEDYVKTWLGREFSLQPKQTALVVDASLFLKLNNITLVVCESGGLCQGEQFAQISVWQEKYGLENEKTSIEREIKISQGETIELYGYKINLAKLSPGTAVFIVSRQENPGEINVHLNDPFKLAQNMSANVLEANIKIEVLGLSDDTVKFSISNYLYSKEYAGKKVSQAAIEAAVTETTAAQQGVQTESMPPMPFEVYSLQAGQSIEKNDYTITVLEVNSNAAVFVVKEKGLGRQIVIQINKGWNLFSLPGEMNSGNSDCDSSNFKIFEYNKRQNKFEIVSSPKIGKAYWIYNAGKTCTAKGTIGKAATFGDLESIGTGWNFIGIIPEMAGKTINEAGNCSFTSAFTFNSAAQKWEKALDKKISENNLGEAMAVFSQGTCNWVAVSETPPMPPAQ
ncbi:MAG: hypothetical protein PHD95_02625 [Candidatus ainarchaeum sp.]|nr:hypothetical protein [Candidatus ainarchaeum sp.]